MPTVRHRGVAAAAGALLLAAAIGSGQSQSASVEEPPWGITLDRSRMVPMRDGVRLSTDLYFPPGPRRGLPVILVRTPYDKGTWRQAESKAVYFARNGYAVLVQDHRGKFESEGEFRAYSAVDRTDGYDTLDWIVGQPWSSGKIGTFGCSYLGEVQDELAAMRHPNHTAAIPQSGAAFGGHGIKNFGFLRYGATELAAALSWNRLYGGTVHYGPPGRVDRAEWFRSPSAQFFNVAPKLPDIDLMAILRTLPVIDMMSRAGAPPNGFESWLRHEPGDPWWNYQGAVTERDRFNVPALHVNSWYDTTPNSTLALFNLFRTNSESARARDNQFLIMSPSTHCRSETATERTFVGARDVGDARLDYDRVYLDWFDHWLKGIENGVTSRPKVQIYVMGKNEWRGEAEWPPARMRVVPYYLHSGGAANSRFGDGVMDTRTPGDEPPDRFAYDPRTPVPTVGGSICCTNGAIAEGGHDQSEVETRHDVLVYTTPPLEHGVEVTGPVTVTLFVGTSAADTDFTAKLVDVYPDGTAYILLDGIIRARYRNGLDRKVWMRPGEVYEVAVDLESTSNYFSPGHKIRLEISSSSFPRWDRNLNTGGNNFDESAPVVARNVVYHSRIHPSRLMLPIVPAANGSRAIQQPNLRLKR